MTKRKVWEKDNPTDYGKEVYTCGDCWILAYYLAKELNSEVGLVGGTRWGHAVARVPGTYKYLDILGLHTKARLTGPDFVYTLRGARTIAHVDPPDTMRGFRRLLADSGPWDYRTFSPAYPATYRTAQATAKKLITKHLEAA